MTELTPCEDLTKVKTMEISIWCVRKLFLSSKAISLSNNRRGNTPGLKFLEQQFKNSSKGPLEVKHYLLLQAISSSNNGSGNNGGLSSRKNRKG